jgi:hypothetical protein
MHKLVDALIDGNADDGVIDELSRRLNEDASARRAYIGYMSLEAELFAVSHDPAGAEFATEGATGAFADSCAADLEPSHRLLASGRRKWLTQWLAIGASILIASGGSSWLTYKQLRDRNVLAPIAAHPDSTAAAGSSKQPVARITGTQNCRWRKNGNQSNVGYGDELSSMQRLELEAGLVEITFSSGVRVLLEGPATFQVPGDQGAELLIGRMTATVPRGTTGFTVRAPRLSINDSGTQFGLVANEESGTEVHVFEGPVLARAIDVSGHELSRIRLISSESARISPKAAEFAMFRSSGDRFVRTLIPAAGPTEGLLALEQFDYPVGPLAWQNGGFGWAGPWADIETGEDVAGVEGAKSNGVAKGSLAACEIISLGNRAEQTGQHNRVRRALSTSFRGVFDAAGLVETQEALRLIGHDNTTVYVSFLQRVSHVNDEFYGFELHRGDGNPNRVLCIGNGGAPGLPKYCVNSTFNMINRQTDDPFVVPLGDEDTDTHFFVIRIDFGSGNHDLMTLYRDPVSLVDEGKCVAVAKLRGNFAFDRVSIANFDGTKIHEVDEVRVGTSFSAVTTAQQSPARNPVAISGPNGEDRLLLNGAQLLTQTVRPNATGVRRSNSFLGSPTL